MQVNKAYLGEQTQIEGMKMDMRCSEQPQGCQGDLWVQH